MIRPADNLTYYERKHEVVKKCPFDKDGSETIKSYFFKVWNLFVKLKEYFIIWGHILFNYKVAIKFCFQNNFLYVDIGDFAQNGPF